MLKYPSNDGPLGKLSVRLFFRKIISILNEDLIAHMHQMFRYLILICIKQQATSVISPLFAILHFIASKCFKDPPLMVIRVTESPRLALNPYQSLILSLQWLNLAAIP